MFAIIRSLLFLLSMKAVLHVHAIEFTNCANSSACNFLMTSNTKNVPAYQILFDFWIYDANRSSSNVLERGIFDLQEAQSNIGNPESIFFATIKTENGNKLSIGAFGSVMDTSMAVPVNEWDMSVYHGNRPQES